MSVMEKPSGRWRLCGEGVGDCVEEMRELEEGEITMGA
jgi:hypothetical protein